MVQPLGSLFLTAIYRSGVFGHFNLYVLTTVYRIGVFALRTRENFLTAIYQRGVFLFVLLSTNLEVLTSCLIYELSRDI